MSHGSSDLEARLGDYRQRHTAAAVAAASRDLTPSLDARLETAGFEDAGPTSIDEFESLPVLSKDAVPAMQEGRGYADMVATGAPVARVFASPGPIYEPQLSVTDPWRFAPALAAVGIGSDDLVLNCFNYHLSPAGVMFDEAARACGARVLPGGVGMAEVQAKAVSDLGVSAFVGMPSYLKALLETFDAAHAPDRWRVTKAMVTAEPLPPALRAELCQRVPVVLMAYGTAEVGLIGYETAADEGLVVSDSTYVEICEPSSGRPVSAGEPGEVVVTVLGGDAYPLVRFGTGDVSRWISHADGGIRLAGVLGRVGAAVKVRGMFVYPHQAAAVISALAEAGVADARFVVESDGATDRLVVEAVVAASADESAVADAVAQRSRGELRVRAALRVIERLEEGPALVDRR